MSELFALSWMGGGAERAFRRRRPGVDDLPWGTLRPRDYPPELLDRARLAWTDGCFVEYATAVQLAGVVQGLLQLRAPVDLIGMAGEFVADEMLHVELHARVVAELGGAVPYHVTAQALAAPPLDPEHPRRALAALVLRTCCIGETLAVPVLAATRRVAAHPLVEAVLARVVEDEGPHAQLGWLFFEWVALDDADRAALGAVAAAELASTRWLREGARSVVRDGRTSEGYELAHVHALGWLDAEAYTPLMAQAAANIVSRLARLGITLPEEAAAEG